MNEQTKNIIKNMSAVAFGLVLCLVIVLLIEGMLAVFHVGEKPAKVIYPKGYHHRDKFGIVRAKAGEQIVSMHIKQTNKIVYSIKYSIDEYSRRITPVDNVGKRNKFAMFIGCSFTFGEGVENNQTLAYYVGENTKQYTPYNYGMHGHGPFDNLARLQSIDYQNEIKEKKGVLIYTFLEPHISRTIGDSTAMQWKIRDIYYKKDKSGELVRKGTFLSQQPFHSSLYFILGKSRILRMLGITFPLKFSQKDISLTADVIEAMKKTFLSHYPQSRFYVLIYPGSLYVKEILEELNQRKIDYLDYTHLFDIHDPKYYLCKEDQHPSAFAYEVLAKKLIQDIWLK